MSNESHNNSQSIQHLIHHQIQFNCRTAHISRYLQLSLHNLKCTSTRHRSLIFILSLAIVLKSDLWQPHACVNVAAAAGAVDVTLMKSLRTKMLSCSSQTSTRRRSSTLRCRGELSETDLMVQWFNIKR